jgi:hypothetical protein
MPEWSLDLPDTLRLAVGQGYSVPLAAAGSAGYQWTVRVTGTAGAIQASVEAGSAPAITPGTMPAARSAPQMLAIRGQRPGRAVVHLELSRPFGADRNPRISQEFVVIVEDRSQVRGEHLPESETNNLAGNI